MKNILRIVLIAVLHWILTLVCALGEFRTARFVLFKAPEPTHPVWMTLLRMFEFPFLMVYRHADPQTMRYYLPVMIVNSLFWGIIINCIVLAARKRARTNPAADSA
jgi:hypothetical protein